TIDVSDPSRPVQLALTSLPNPVPFVFPDAPPPEASAVAIKDGLVWVGAFGTGIINIYDVTRPAVPRLVGQADVGPPAEDDPEDFGVYGILFAGDRAYVIGEMGFSGLKELEIRHPRNVLMRAVPNLRLLPHSSDTAAPTSGEWRRPSNVTSTRTRASLLLRGGRP